MDRRFIFDNRVFILTIGVFARMTHTDKVKQAPLNWAEKLKVCC